VNDDSTPPGPGSFDAGSASAAESGRRGAGLAGRKLSIRPGVIVALAVAIALIVFVVQNDREVPVTWWFVEVDGPLWAVIVVAAVAGALLAEVLGWAAGRRRRRRGRRHRP